MKKFLLSCFVVFISSIAYSQADAFPTKVFGNDSLYNFLNSAPEKIKVGEQTYFPTCSFIHDRARKGKLKPYYWNCFLKCAGQSKTPPNILQQKLYILTDTTIYEYSYLPKAYGWSKTVDLYEKPVAVIIEFLDTTTNKKYYVKAKGPFPVKH